MKIIGVKPVSGFGDINAKILILGLGPCCSWWNENWHEHLQVISLENFYLDVSI